MNSLGIPSAVDHFETVINVKGSTIDQVYPQVYFMWVCLCLGWGLIQRPSSYDICQKNITFATCAYKVKIVRLFSWCKKRSAMTEQLRTNNTHALASSSLAAMHLKTLQMQSDDPNDGILRMK